MKSIFRFISARVIAATLVVAGTALGQTAFPGLAVKGDLVATWVARVEIEKARGRSRPQLMDLQLLLLRGAEVTVTSRGALVEFRQVQVVLPDGKTEFRANAAPKLSVTAFSANGSSFARYTEGDATYYLMAPEWLDASNRPNFKRVPILEFEFDGETPFRWRWASRDNAYPKPNPFGYLDQAEDARGPMTQSLDALDDLARDLPKGKADQELTTRLKPFIEGTYSIPPYSNVWETILNASGKLTTELELRVCLHLLKTKKAAIAQERAREALLRLVEEAGTADAATAQAALDHALANSPMIGHSTEELDRLVSLCKRLPGNVSGLYAERIWDGFDFRGAVDFRLTQLLEQATPDWKLVQKWLDVATSSPHWKETSVAALFLSYTANLSDQRAVELCEHFLAGRSDHASEWNRFVTVLCQRMEATAATPDSAYWKLVPRAIAKSEYGHTARAVESLQRQDLKIGWALFGVVESDSVPAVDAFGRILEKAGNKDVADVAARHPSGYFTVATMGVDPALSPPLGLAVDRRSFWLTPGAGANTSNPGQFVVSLKRDRIPAPVKPVEGQAWVLATLKLNLAWIPPGSTTIPEVTRRTRTGTYPVSKARAAEVRAGFWLGKLEVTEAQWELLGFQLPKAKSIRTGNEDYPAAGISAEDALRFCALLTEQERSLGRLPDGWIYCLPREDQWIHAAIANNELFFKSAPEVGWFSGIHPVGKKPANAWGLHDVSGNVAEWCLISEGGPKTNSPAALLANWSGRAGQGVTVLRGAGFASRTPSQWTPFYRSETPTWLASTDTGFRLCLAREETASSMQATTPTAATASFGSGQPINTDREAPAKAQPKLRAEPRPWKIDKPLQDEIDAREGVIRAPAQPPTNDRSLFEGAKVYHIDQLDAKPALRTKIEPSYPFEMRRANISGKVTVDFIVDANGNVQDAYAAESTNAAFEPTALQALRTWKYKPGRKGGRDVPTHMQITFQFSPGR